MSQVVYRDAAILFLVAGIVAVTVMYVWSANKIAQYEVFIAQQQQEIQACAFQIQQQQFPELFQGR